MKKFIGQIEKCFHKETIYLTLNVCCTFQKTKKRFLDDTLPSNYILLGVMSCNFSVIFDCPIICNFARHLNILTNQTPVADWWKI
jgi:hypothetical protein